MSDKPEVNAEEEVEDQSPETSSEEENLSYDDEFEALWGEGLVSDQDDDEEDLPTSNEEDEPDAEPAEAEEEDDTEVEQEAEPSPRKPKPAKAEEDPYSWIDSLPEEARNKATLMRNQALSHQGRATAFQRRVEELQQELRRLEKARAEEPADRKPKGTESAAPEMPEKFKQLKEDFPEFAEALEEIQTTERERYEQLLQRRLEPLEVERAQKERSQFEEAVSRAAEEIFHTNETGVHWKDVVNGQDFAAWLHMQPKSVRQAASIPDPAEAIYVLRRYEEDYQREVERLGLNQPPQAENTGPSEEVTRAEQLKRERAERKRKSTAPGSRPAETDKESEGFDYYAEFDRQWGS